MGATTTLMPEGLPKRDHPTTTVVSPIRIVPPQPPTPHTKRPTVIIYQKSEICLFRIVWVGVCLFGVGMNGAGLKGGLCVEFYCNKNCVCFSSIAGNCGSSYCVVYYRVSYFGAFGYMLFEETCQDG